MATWPRQGSGARVGWEAGVSVRLSNPRNGRLSAGGQAQHSGCGESSSSVLPRTHAVSPNRSGLHLQLKFLFLLMVGGGLLPSFRPGVAGTPCAGPDRTKAASWAVRRRLCCPWFCSEQERGYGVPRPHGNCWAGVPVPPSSPVFPDSGPCCEILTSSPEWYGDPWGPLLRPNFRAQQQTMCGLRSGHRRPPHACPTGPASQLLSPPRPRPAQQRA